MTSNRQIFENSLKFEPQDEGILSGDESLQAYRLLELDGKSLEELTELRNYLVMSYAPITTYLISKGSDEATRKEYYKVQDKMSALVGVIDHELFKLGELY